MKTKIIFLLLITVLEINAEIRFVSKTGISKPPYTSWATAADSIQKAINICNPGDTVFIGNGAYQDTVKMNPGIALIGSGIDSCIIDSRKFSDTTSFYTIKMADSCSVKNICIVGSGWNHGVGIYCRNMNYPQTESSNRMYTQIECCKISNCAYGIYLFNSDSKISKNISYNIQRAVHVESYYPFYKILIDNNYFTGYGVQIVFGTRTTIRNNVIFIKGSEIAYAGGGSDSVWVYNNLVIANKAFYGFANVILPSVICNNIISGTVNAFSSNVENYNIFKNNIIANGRIGLAITGKPIVSYNVIWNTIKPYYYSVPDSTNKIIDPMFANEDSLDFHLQMYSPLIHAGDPDIKNADGSRSDIGLYGGPYGESYTYQDLAPRPPHNLASTINGTILKINWAKNTEADFAYYRIYRDTIPGFIPDTTKRIAKTNDTTYTELFKPGRNYYYKISATDNQGNESPKSDEVKLITGVNDKPVIEAEDYTLFANYPNPFNPSTRICYRLNKPGNVSLKVYDIKGSLVKQILNKWQEAGYYEEEFTGEKKQANDYIERFASGVYVLVIEVKNENNIPVYTNSRKMMMLK